MFFLVLYIPWNVLPVLYVAHTQGKTFDSTRQTLKYAQSSQSFQSSRQAFNSALTPDREEWESVLCDVIFSDAHKSGGQSGQFNRSNDADDVIAIECTPVEEEAGVTERISEVRDRGNSEQVMQPRTLNNKAFLGQHSGGLTTSAAYSQARKSYNPDRETGVGAMMYSSESRNSINAKSQDSDSDLSPGTPELQTIGEVESFQLQMSNDSTEKAIVKKALND